MGFGEQLRRRRKELGYSREELAQKLGITGSAVGNYETGVSAPRESVLLRLFDVLQVEPNYLYRDFYAAGRQGEGVSSEEASLLRKYRELGLTARQTLCTMLDALGEQKTLSEIRQLGALAAPLLRGPGVRRGLRAADRGRGSSRGGGAGGAHPGRQHGALHPGRVRGVCKP